MRFRVVGNDTEDEASYDHLVIALGSVTRLPDVPGLSRFGFAMAVSQGVWRFGKSSICIDM